MGDIDMELLISLVENRPVLWDKIQECYKNRQSSFAAWREICLALNEGFETMSEKEKNDFGKDVIKKWNNARDNWMKYHKKVKECKSGSGAKSQRKYKFYDQMLFLCKIVTCRTTEAIITSEKNITQSHNKKTDSQTNNDPTAPANTTDKTKTSKMRKTDCSEVDRQMLTLIKSVEDEDKSKSMCFFKGIAPIVDKYSDDDYVEFQYEVIKVIRNLSRRNQASMQQQNYNYNINGGYTTATSDYRIQEYQPTQPIPSTSRIPYEYQPTQLIPSTSRIPQELMQQDDSQPSIITELSSITSPDYDFDFSKTP
ncbi:hypothetical protein EVAR_88565_1 [Eumeta japonica]|uniref:MADF domain-containing protein n=1 Tax=Eumeta variegata TaxID=151549 RepID=A0A4C1WM01_EUMVA|nr:hypothetical protein EVAR_88565_1 [Eumeta japonica]